jgi:Tfp pilus assembly protein PilX
MKRNREQKGFALVAALMANLILLAVGIVALNLSTGDIRVSMRSVGDKKALNAAETGVHELSRLFDPATAFNGAVFPVSYRALSGGQDTTTQYSIAQPIVPPTGPSTLQLNGYAIGGAQMWGQTRYSTTVTGRNTAFNTSVTVDVEVGFGPIEIYTMSR